MATMTATMPMQSERRGGAGRLLVVLLIAVLVVCGTQYSHAVARHGQDAIRAQQCFDKHGHSQRWYQPSNDAYVFVCIDGENNVYLQVLRRIRGKVEEITKYSKNGVHNLEDMAKILEDQGARLEWVLK